MRGFVLLAGAGVVAAVLLAFWASTDHMANDAPGIEVRTSPELASASEAISKGDPPVQWYTPPTLAQGSGDGPDLALATQDVRQAIRSAANSLAGIDYGSLSLPQFVTETAQLKIRPGDFSQGDVWLDQWALGGSTHLALFAWRGPEFPQRADRPLVHRWVQVYALYDVTGRKVIRLLATVAGEVQE